MRDTIQDFETMSKFEYLPGWNIEKLELREGGYMAAGTYPTTAETCPKCRAVGTLSRHGSKSTAFQDAPVHGRQTTIIVERQRYRCKACGATSLQPLPDVDERHRMLRRCLDHIQRQSVRQPFSQIANDIGLDEKTVRLVASEHMSRLNQNALANSPRRLEISELTVLRKPRLLFADMDGPCLVDLLETRGARSVANWLGRLSARQNVRIVSIGMRRPYREAIRSILPHAGIVVNKQHLLTVADQSFDALVEALAKDLERKARLKLIFNWHLLTRRSCELPPATRLDLQVLLAEHPTLSAAYQAKEQFHDLCSLDSRAKAKAAYDLWRKHLPDGPRHVFRPLLAAMSVWETEVLESWDHPTRVDFLELANGGLKAVNRLGKGYSFPVLRARLLFGQPFSGSTFICEGCLGEYPIEIREKSRRPVGSWCPNCHRLQTDKWFKQAGR